MLEEMIVRYSSPTLAGLKTANMFNFRFDCLDHLKTTLRRINKQLVPKGLRLIPMRFSEKSVLIYLFRPEKLKHDLSDCTACSILKEKGYCIGNVSVCLSQLREKLMGCGEFPHEIGLFLGYPSKDVYGFIENKAYHYKISGVWKVYSDKEYALKMFERFKKCNRIYMNKWYMGSTVQELAVAG